MLISRDTPPTVSDLDDPLGESKITDRRVTGWLIPALLMTLIGILGWMALTLQDMSRTLAVAAYQIQDHERRIENLETLFLHPNDPVARRK